MNTVSPAPLTPVSHASVFTSLHPYEHGIRHLFKESLEASVPTIAQLFAANGYETAAIVSCPGMNRWYGFDVGFYHYDDEIPKLCDGSDPLETVDVKKRGLALKRAPVVVERGLSWLESHHKTNFFLFLHFFDTHWPYDPPEWFAPHGANPYEGEAHYADHYLGLFIDKLEEWGLMENTVIIIFSDHGEDLAGWYSNDHAGEKLGHPEENGHGCLLYDATQMVPLIFAAPGLIPEGVKVFSQVRLIDILPTVQDLFRLEDAGIRSGSTLVPLFSKPGAHRTAYFETYYREEQNSGKGGIPGLGPWTGVRIDNRVKLVNDILSGSTAVYHLDSDPLEKSPVIFGNVKRSIF